MSAHPSLRSSQPPRGNSFSRAKQRREDHEAKSNHPERQSQRAPAARSFRRMGGVHRVYRRQQRQNHQRRYRPSPLCLIDPHAAFPLWWHRLQSVLWISPIIRSDLAPDTVVASLGPSAAQHLRKKCPRVYSMRRIMRASINAARLLQMRAQIARSSLLLHHSLSFARSLQVFHHHLERMQIDVSVRTVPRAKPAPDAPVFDNHFQRISPPNRSYRTSHHAQRVAALPARSRHQILIEPQAFPHQPCDSVMCVSASINASIAPRAIFQIQNQKALRFHQTLRKKLIDGHAPDRLHPLLVLRAAFRCNCFQSLAYARESLHHLAKIVARNSHHFHVVQRRTSRRTYSAAQQSNLPEIIAAGKISQHQFSAGIRLRNFHESNAHQIETARRIALPRDYLPRRKSLQLHALLSIAR